MNNILLSCRIGAAIAALLLALPWAEARGQGAERPNFIVFVADDLGWRDIVAYGNRFIDTPSLDWLPASASSAGRTGAQQHAALAGPGDGAALPCRHAGDPRGPGALL